MHSAMSDCSDDEAVTDKQLKVVIVGDGASGKVQIIMFRVS